jgi:hypothetical protein
MISRGSPYQLIRAALKVHGSATIPEGLQPVATAPKDGTKNILSALSGTRKRETLCRHGRLSDGKWHGNTREDEWVYELTRWMPLPSPPIMERI